ncbi:HpaII family restriction endonuclease [Falsiporphyromonas endometrii]|uniref:HpaII family restriction endonuclease n=1 Tax=Falsiporphyromonas endometrii TaxID=1387297 RepID=A0ABV9KA03_9PORP
MITANKGEWSEIYAFFKLLGDGILYAGDQNLDKINDLFYPIIMILREETEGSFNYKRNAQDVSILNSDKEELLRVPADVFLEEAEKLLRVINSGKGAFAAPKIEEFMNNIFCYSVKAKPSDKTDIKIVLHDKRTKLNSLMGFSIKSQLGSDSTLLNAGKTTNFRYRIVGGSFSDSDIDRINSITGRTKIIQRVDAIRNNGGKLVFDCVDDRAFRNNLLLLDSDLGKILAELLVLQFRTGMKQLRDLVSCLTQLNPLNYDNVTSVPYYEYKIKHLLTSTALGMVPGSPWTGRFDANGGYIVVKKDGDIVCYHFYDRNRFEDYLFNNAYLERPSSSRHEYASIIKDSDVLYFKLNCQIRLR